MSTVTTPTRNAWLLGLAGTLLAWLSIGVDIAGPDQQLYIPYLRHFAHPELYPGDYIFDSDNYRATLFVPLVGTLHRWLGGDLVPLLYVVHALSLFALFSGLAAATARVSRGAGPAWVVAFLSWPPPVPGAAAAVWEPSPHPRTLAVALAVWAMRHAIDGRALPTALLVTATMLIHPLLGLAAFAGAALALSSGAIAGDDRAAARRALTLFFVVTVALVLVSRLIWPVQQSELTLRPAAWFVDVATASFLWFRNWLPSVWLTLLAWLALFAIGAAGQRDLATTRLIRFGLAGAPLFVAALVGMQLRSPLLVALQLHRGLYVLVIVAVILIGRRLAAAAEAGRLPLPLLVVTSLLPLTHSLALPWLGLAVALAYPHLQRAPAWLGWLTAMLLACPIALRFRPHHLPASTPPDWIALQRWAAASTPIERRFLAPPVVPDFRVFSARGNVIGEQDRQPTIFNRAMADAWRARGHALDGYASHDCAALVAAARRFGADDVVTDFDCALPLIHREGHYRVYGSAKIVPP